MSDEPNVLTGEQADALDPQQAAVYEAENEARTRYEEELDYLTPNTVQQFSVDALTKAGEHFSGDESPNFRFDIPDESDSAGALEGVTNDIRLHSKLLDPWIILHELAHWRVGVFVHHGPLFCAVYVRLVRAGIGEDAAELLLSYFQEYDVEVLDFDQSAECGSGK